MLCQLPLLLGLDDYLAHSRMAADEKPMTIAGKAHRQRGPEAARLCRHFQRILSDSRPAELLHILTVGWSLPALGEAGPDLLPQPPG
jgi:hypothetical protein